MKRPASNFLSMNARQGPKHMTPGENDNRNYKCVTKKNPLLQPAIGKFEWYVIKTPAPASTLSNSDPLAPLLPVAAEGRFKELLSSIRPK